MSVCFWICTYTNVYICRYRNCGQSTVDDAMICIQIDLAIIILFIVGYVHSKVSVFKSTELIFINEFHKEITYNFRFKNYTMYYLFLL